MSGPFMTWKDSYSVGHALIDADHKRLMEIFNRLAAAAEADAPEDALSDIIFDLVDYVEVHFAREESLFCNAGYPKAEHHMRMHRNLERQVRAIAEKFHSGPDEMSIEGVLTFLRDWLTGHILGADQEIVRYIDAERGKGLDGLSTTTMFAAK